MRVLLDTNIFVYMSTDPEYLSWDVLAIITRFAFYRSQGLDLIFNEK